jgi:hypothetical protein
MKAIQRDVSFLSPMEEKGERDTHTFLGAYLEEAERCLLLASA